MAVDFLSWLLVVSQLVWLPGIKGLCLALMVHLFVKLISILFMVLRELESRFVLTLMGYIL